MSSGSGATSGPSGSGHGDLIDVQQRADGRPVRFVWRGRLFVIRLIQESWEAGPAPEGSGAGRGAAFFRVLAAPGQGMPEGVFELRRDARDGSWTLRPDVNPALSWQVTDGAA